MKPTSRLGMSALSESLDGTYGWRARIGFITVAATIETPVYEFHLIAPPGMVLVSVGLSVTTVDKSSVSRVMDELASAATELSRYHVDHIVVSGNPVAYLSETPSTRAKEIEAIVAEASGVATTFEWSATIDALRHVGAHRLAVASPFTDEHNAKLASALEIEGFDVRGTAGMGLDANPEITLQPVGAAYRAAHQAYRAAGGADALYIACPRWPVVPAIEPLELDLGIPVVASVPAWLWSVSRTLGVETPVSGYGTLLRDR